MKGWTESPLQFALLQQDSRGCNMHFRSMALHRGPREMRENNSIARSCQKAAAVFRNSKVSLFFCCTIRNIQTMGISKNKIQLLLHWLILLLWFPTDLSQRGFKKYECQNVNHTASFHLSCSSCLHKQYAAKGLKGLSGQLIGAWIIVLGTALNAASSFLLILQGQINGTRNCIWSSSLHDKRQESFCEGFA